MVPLHIQERPDRPNNKPHRGLSPLQRRSTLQTDGPGSQRDAPGRLPVAHGQSGERNRGVQGHGPVFGLRHYCDPRGGSLGQRGHRQIVQ